MKLFTTTVFLLCTELVFAQLQPGRSWSFSQQVSSTGPFGGLVSTNNLVAYWRMDEVDVGTSVTRNDSFGANNLSDNGSTVSATGVVTNACDFETSTSDYLSISDNAALSMASGTSFTITGWINLESTGTRPLISKGSGAGTSTEYIVTTDSTGTNILFRVADGTNQATATVNGGVPSTSTWYFIAARCDLGADTVYLSVNGGTNATAAYTGDTTDGGSAVNVGRVVYATANRMDGLIDEVGVWKRVLTDVEVTYLYNGGAGRPL